MDIREVNYHKTIIPGSVSVVVADIGGTNSNFGLCSIHHETVTLLCSAHIKSEIITDFNEAISEVLQLFERYWSLKPEEACIGVAGVVSEDQHYSKLTNRPFSIDAHDIEVNTSLKRVILINDFDAVAYGLDAIDSTAIQTIYKGKCKPYGQKAIIGAGTGLGKSMLYYSNEYKRYVPLSSEGGHADSAIQYKKELELSDYIRQEHGIQGSISWEDILSGHGLQCIYTYLGQKNNYTKNKYDEELRRVKLHPDQIFAYHKSSKQAEDTVEWFTQFYARCAKDFALNTLSLAGLYISGGIAANNPDMFDRPIFMQEFLDNHKQKELLACMPLYVVTDYNISLFGAAVYLMITAK